jgi:hypothetical protein
MIHWRSSEDWLLRSSCCSFRTSCQRIWGTGSSTGSCCWSTSCSRGCSTRCCSTSRCGTLCSMRSVSEGVVKITIFVDRSSLSLVVVAEGSQLLCIREEPHLTIGTVDIQLQVDDLENVLVIGLESEDAGLFWLELNGFAYRTVVHRAVGAADLLPAAGEGGRSLERRTENRL